MKELENPEAIADGNLTEIEETKTEQELQQLVALVEPILSDLFKHAALEKDFWLKKKSVELLANWIQSMIQINQMLSAQSEALQQFIGDNIDVESLPKKRIWTPHP